MSRFKFRDFLNEALDDKQRAKVDGWDRGDYSFSDHAFGGKENDVIHIPLKDESSVVVENHIKEHGYKVKDYHKGLATDKYGRDMRLGKVLEKTNAPEWMRKQFQVDLSRKVKPPDDYHVMISRHPHDIAAMSTGQHWTSCMNIDHELNSHYLKSEVKHGTHVAYLVHKDDTEAKAPLARLALKPLHDHANAEGGDKGPGHTILVPEGRVYGHGGDAFNSTVNEWAKKEFPAQEGRVYQKNRFVYNDGGKSTLFKAGEKTKALVLSGGKIPGDTKYNEYRDQVLIGGKFNLDELKTHLDTSKLPSGDLSMLVGNPYNGPKELAHLATLPKVVLGGAKSALLGHRNLPPDTVDDLYKSGKITAEDTFTAGNRYYDKNRTAEVVKAGMSDPRFEHLNTLGTYSLHKHYDEIFSKAPAHIADRHSSRMVEHLSPQNKEKFLATSEHYPDLVTHYLSTSNYDGNADPSDFDKALALKHIAGARDLSSATARYSDIHGILKNDEVSHSIVSRHDYNSHEEANGAWKEERFINGLIRSSEFYKSPMPKTAKALTDHLISNPETAKGLVDNRVRFLSKYPEHMERLSEVPAYHLSIGQHVKEPEATPKTMANLLSNKRGRLSLLYNRNAHLSGDTLQHIWNKLEEEPDPGFSRLENAPVFTHHENLPTHIKVALSGKTSP